MAARTVEESMKKYQTNIEKYQTINLLKAIGVMDRLTFIQINQRFKKYFVTHLYFLFWQKATLILRPMKWTFYLFPRKFQGEMFVYLILLAIFTKKIAIYIGAGFGLGFRSWH